jgi:hypothetical protein
VGRTTTVQSATGSSAIDRRRLYRDKARDRNRQARPRRAENAPCASRRGTLVLAQLLVAASVALAAVGCAFHGDPAKRNPCDAANRTTDKLHHAVDAFHFALPADATDVSFATSEGWTAYSVTLVFRTTPDGLARFFATSKFPTPSQSADPKPAGQLLAAGTPECELDHGFTYSAIVSRDSTYPDLIRSLAIDNTNSNAPRVLVVAAVL